MGTLGLSTSSLSTFRDCPRCFWLEKNTKVKRPRGIFPSLPKGMDRVMKAQVEGIIANGGIVPALALLPDAQPFADRARMAKFRSWRTFQRVFNVDGLEVTAWGELDDLIEHLETGLVTPWDYKTKGDEPDESYGKKYYQNQLDMYHFILEGPLQKLNCTGKGILSYGWPVAIEPIERHQTTADVVIFGWKNLVLDTDPARAVEVLEAAVRCLLGPQPADNGTCEYCNFYSQRVSFIQPEPVVAAPKSTKKTKTVAS